MLDDLDLSDSSSDDVEQADTTVNSHKALPEDGRFEDANESPSAASVEDTFHKHEQPADNSNATSFNTNQKPRRHMPKRIRKKVHVEP